MPYRYSAQVKMNDKTQKSNAYPVFLVEKVLQFLIQDFGKKMFLCEFYYSAEYCCSAHDDETKTKEPFVILF